MSCKESELWYNAMQDEMSSMKCNDVWDLVELPNGAKAIGSHFDLELQQMDVKTTFLNGELEEEVYMKQPEGFPSSDESVMDQCIYLKFNGSKVCFLVLYMDDILLATNNKGLLHEVKQFLSKYFDMNDMGETSYVISIKIHKNRFQGILGLSQETYINKVLERFWMKNCSLSVSPIVKGDRFNLDQCSKNDLERKQMKNIPYASAVGSLMYAQVCTKPDIAFVVGMLGRYQSNPCMDHWKAVKKMMRYLQGTKDYKLMYKQTSNLEVVGYSDSDFAGCVDSCKSTSGYIFILAGRAISWRSVKVMDSISRPLSIYCDNSAAVFMAKNNKSGSQIKHIDIKYLAIREHVKEKKVVIEHISTELMIVDPLTKGMPPLKFKDHVVNMRLSSLM
ncbi:Retrovirus-related Pol polyprotein from transposon TNT 1-94 [Vitis vinifera]|uniref:Retrovirus-related Pol polyprotein from transposon TNT 1-94 n=1 Tax=Vitis vinifera TaxID=29760 RepID=A0A438E6Q2_VITVI|nr:Retrovirus-related Pol polyprotein from transposon TNT 1-94 [Vitis vinifera]